MKENIWDNLFDVRKYKRWIDEIPDSECKICSANAKVLWIKREEVFPSWHFSPPSHPNCDCRLEYSNYKTNIDINTQVNTMTWRDLRNEKNWYSKWLIIWEKLLWEKRALKAVKRIYSYAKRYYPENYKYMIPLIYEEQSHLTLWENSYEWFNIDLWKIWHSRWLSQIKFNAPKSDEEYFWYKDTDIRSVLDEFSHLRLMNERIELIKKKLKEEWLKINAENIEGLGIDEGLEFYLQIRISMLENIEKEWIYILIT